jgi:4-amino-4-deoxy-L-arabinose transferase-like glycosyltransferase
VAGVVTVALLALSTRYGPHRDELYFVLLGRHPQWGYPDQPPLTPLIAGAADALAPGSLFALRLVPALLVGAVVVLSAGLCRLAKGDAQAQALTALTVGLGGMVLFAGHLLSTATVDLFFQVLIIRLLLGTLSKDPGPGWLWVGLAVGVGLQNKTLVVFTMGALVLGIALTRELRRHLISPWAIGGGLLAVLIWLPNLIWQAQHDWPQFTLAEDITSEYGGAGGILQFLVLQLTILSPAAFILVYRGFRKHRPLAVAYAALLVFFALTGGKFYYLAPVVIALAAVGIAALTNRRRWTVILVLVALFPIPALLPVLPEKVYVDSFYPALNGDALETVGWPQVVEQVRAATADAPPDSVIVTGNYGEAGALDWYGVDLPVFSGHNGLAAFGPPRSTGVVYFLGESHPFEATCEMIATLDTGADNEEDGVHVWRCPVPANWKQAWEHVTHLSG